MASLPPPPPRKTSTFTSLIRKDSLKGPSPSDSNYFTPRVTSQPQLKDMGVVKDSSGTTRVVTRRSGGGGSSYSPVSAPTSLVEPSVPLQSTSSIKKGGLANIGSGQSDSAFKPKGGVQTVGSSPVAYTETRQEERKGLLQEKIRNLESDVQANPYDFESTQKRMELRSLKDELSFLQQSKERQQDLRTAATIITAAGGALLAPVALPGLVGTAAAGISQATALMYAAPEASKGTYNVINPSKLSKKQQRDIGKLVEERVSQRVTETGLNIPGVGKEVEQYTGGLVGDIVYSLPGGRLAASTKAQKAYEEILIEKGYSAGMAKEIASAEVGREVFAGGVGELIAFGASAQAVGEISGAATQKGINLFTKASQRTFTPTGARVFGAVSGAVGGGVGGALETAVSFPAFQKGRFRDVKVDDWITAIVFGLGTAAGAGALIGAFTGKEGTQKLIYGGLSALEGGQEYAGDITAKAFVGEAFESDINISGKGVAKTPQTTVTFNIAQLFGVGSPNVTATDSKTSGVTKDYVEKQVWNPAPTKDTSLTKDLSKDLVITDIPTTSNTPGISKTDGGKVNEDFALAFVPSKEDDFVDDLAITDQKSETKEDTKSQTFTQSLVPIQTQALFYTLTAPFPPLVPFGLGTGSGKGSLRKRSSGKYYDELAAAKSLFKEFQTQQAPFKPKKPGVAKKPTKAFNPELTFTPFSTKQKKGKRINFGNVFNTSRKGKLNVFSI